MSSPPNKSKFLTFEYWNYTGWCKITWIYRQCINLLTPNDLYMSRTAPLTSKRCILYIYSTNVGTEYFKHVLYSPFFFSSKCSLFHNANLFGSCIIHILHTRCTEIKKSFRRQRVNLMDTQINIQYLIYSKCLLPSPLIQCESLSS